MSDVSDDVRRAAVMCLGFVLYQTPEQCPRVVSLLAESYNPHMRYGAALAVGIACSGTGLKEAISLLEPLTSDAVDYVRQVEIPCDTRLIRCARSVAPGCGWLRDNI